MSAPLRPALPPRHDLNNRIAAMTIPARIGRLPVSPAGYPVPFFVQWFEDGKPSDRGIGTPDFRVADAAKIGLALRKKLCWTCGEPLGAHLAFLIGPMCAVNRVISEPPSHFQCAEFSAKACPFLSQPRMRRNEKDPPEDGIVGAPGFGFKRNPGAACVWITRSFKIFRPEIGNDGILFHLGTPERVFWYAEGREATRAEILASIESGLPLLRKAAELQGQHAVAALDGHLAAVMPLLPEDAAPPSPPPTRARADAGGV